ncbi:MAG: sigma-70 family RNA polymerase sigma factor [Bacteroidota bacterium]
MAHRSAPPPSDEVLIRQVRHGETWAYRVLVERYEGQVAATVIGMLGRGPEADDVGQETFIRFYESLDRFRGEASVGTYLTRIAINQSLKALRKQRSWTRRFIPRSHLATPPPDPADTVTALDHLDRREREALVTQAVQALSPKHRAVVVLRMLQGLSTNETAEALGVPPGTVMSRLSRALASLKGSLAALDIRPGDADLSS